jgi:sterol desaturase/sphingolipid hydroxylase (fatty acid hydroxylase superfamily)
MNPYLDAAQSSFFGYANYLLREFTHPGWTNYVTMLVGVSLFFLIWEQLAPWRQKQARIRRDFWIDGFYLFFNFFLFSLVGFSAVSAVAALGFHDLVFRILGLQNLVAAEIGAWPIWTQLLVMFVLRDFLQYWIHRLLHRVDFLWRFHQVHHSTQEMGFAAHMRFHPAETVFYRTLEYIPLAMVGFGVEQFFVVHAFATAIGHFNHSNVRLPLGPLRFVFNSPSFHIWHHMKEFPQGTRGVNFAISLSIWDYLFGTAQLPRDGRDIVLGFPGVDRYPTGFGGHLLEPFRRR